MARKSHKMLDSSIIVWNKHPKFRLRSLRSPIIIHKIMLT